MCVSFIGALAILSGILWAVYDHLSLPVVYKDPKGACVIVVEWVDEKRLPRDCGWERGRRYAVETIGFRMKISQLYD